MLEYVGICWNMLEYVGICCTMLDYVGLCWNMLEYVGICWNMLEHVRIWWNMLEYVGICWNMLEYDGICWNMLEYGGICWNMLEYLLSSIVFRKTTYPRSPGLGCLGGGRQGQGERQDHGALARGEIRLVSKENPQMAFFPGIFLLMWGYFPMSRIPNPQMWNMIIYSTWILKNDWTILEWRIWARNVVIEYDIWRLKALEGRAREIRSDLSTLRTKQRGVQQNL